MRLAVWPTSWLPICSTLSASTAALVLLFWLFQLTAAIASGLGVEQSRLKQQEEIVAMNEVVQLKPLTNFSSTKLATWSGGNHSVELKVARLKRKIPKIGGQEAEAEVRSDETSLSPEGPKNSAANSLLPTFSAPIGNVTAVLGRDVRLVCQVENLGQYQVAWLREETNTILSIDTNIIITNYRIFLIPDEEQRKWALHIKDVKESDTGAYQCQVNTNPMRSTSGYLRVVVPPTILQSETSQMAEVTEHSSVSIQCKTSGNPKPTVVWKRDDGFPIKLNGSFQSGSSGEPRGGDQLMQPPAIDTSLSGSLNLSSIEHLDNQHDQEQPIAELSAIRSEKLNLHDVDRSMAGVYVCTASNRISTPALKRIPVYVKFPPTVSLNTSYISQPLGGQLEVDCIIEAFPKANSYWSKKPAPQFHRSDRARWLANERNVAFAAALNRDLKVQKRFKPISDNSNRQNSSLLADDEQANSDEDAQDDETRRFVSPYQQAHRHRSKSIESSSALISDNQMYQPGKSRLTRLAVSEQRDLKLVETSGDSKSVVSVMQTALNSYTYRLRLTIAKLKPDDFGEYSCVAINSLGSAEAQVSIVSGTDKLHHAQEPLGDDARDPESLPGIKRNSQEEARFQQAQQSIGSRRSSTSGQRVVYDANYLQAIKTRQNGSGKSNKLEQKLAKSNYHEPANGSLAAKAEARLITILTGVLSLLLVRFNK